MEIWLATPALDLVADEWLDPQAPLHYRMQLVSGKQIKEWQTGDEAGHFTYQTSPDITGLACGPTVAVQAAPSSLVLRWTLDSAQLATTRAARWQSGPWAVGAHYLRLALDATSLRSLGTAGTGAAAALTLAAESDDIAGTLLLRLDPTTFTLREVQELRLNNGQTETTIPWRLTAQEPVANGKAVGVLDPPLGSDLGNVQRGPLLDAACPLLFAEQQLSLPKLLTSQIKVLLVGLDHRQPVSPGRWSSGLARVRGWLIRRWACPTPTATSPASTWSTAATGGGST